ncbi:MAG: fructose-bisphosphatase class II [Candidatus Loosdrechtia sp.]|uniref:fructose-bisphosphatase class II n=1 Tax=Candidatus Loosdrechtia sp. TaxID=3101272 RepID=UPI003A61FD41|nr:MAG: fructose-bisphosphatase class II [Candidatus Jettenia sp. AMX2]
MKITKDGILFIKDESFDPKRIDDPHILEAYIPEAHYLRMSGEGLQLVNRNELRHAVGVVAARSLRYMGTNDQGFNIFRLRSMAIWWLRHIYNSFNWWKAYVVNAEGERADMPMLYIGEEFGTSTGHTENEVDIVLSAFENARCLVSQKYEGGVIFAVGYSERGGLFNSPDMYGVKTIVGNRYKGAGVSVVYGITKNLHLMAGHILKKKNKEISGQNIRNEIKQMKVVVLDRPRHNKLIKRLREYGAQLILVNDDDLTPTLAVTQGEIDLIIGVGGIPEAILSAIIVEELGGEMTLRILPSDVARDEKLLGKISNWNYFRKNEVDILKNFKIVRPGTEKGNEIPWDSILSSKDLARGEDKVFTASIIKKNSWIRFPDGRVVPGVEMELETGTITVYVVRIEGKNMEIVPVLYKTAINKYPVQNNYKYSSVACNRLTGDILFEMEEAYAEFGMFQKAKECIRAVKTSECMNDDLIQKCNFLYEYVEGLDDLANKPAHDEKAIISHFEKVCRLGREDEVGIRSARMIKKFYEYLGDKYCHNHHDNKAISCYKEALKYSTHELKLYRKVDSIYMKDMLEEYFHLIDRIYEEHGYREPDNWEQHKLGIALDIFNGNEGYLKSLCREPWLIFFRRTVLHGEKPSYKLAILTKLLWLQERLSRANDEELSLFLIKEFGIRKDEIDSILNYRKEKKLFRSVIELYCVPGLSLECLTKLLLPQVKVESQNELEDAHIPLSISFVEAMERRYENMMDELKEGFMKEAQEHSYALAEAYHYVGLALYHIGDDEGAKEYYKKALVRFGEIIEKFEGITLVNAQYRIGNLYEELALLYEREQEDFYNRAIDAYTCIVDEHRSKVLFGSIRELISVRIKQARERIEHLKKELNSVMIKANPG